MLDHVYSDAQLTRLKNRDRAVADVIVRSINSGLSLCLFLGSLELNQSGSAVMYRYKDWEPEEYEENQLQFIPKQELRPSSTSAPTLIPLQPITLGKAVNIDVDEELLPKDYFDTQDADEESVEEHTGNEGATFTRWYRRTALLLVLAEQPKTAPAPATSKRQRKK